MVILTSKQLRFTIPFIGTVNVAVDGTGRSGDVNIASAGNLTVSNSRIESNAKGSDAAGNVMLTSPGQILFNNSKIISSTSNRGNAGSIAFTAGQGIRLTNNSQLSALTSSTGKAGDILFTSPIISVAGGAEISAETQGVGAGGSITLNASTAVNLLRQQDTSPVLSVEASGAGKAGDIVINTPTLTLADQARITATATATATNTDGGGSITLNASQMNLAGIVGVFAETQGQAPAGTLQLNPYANQSTLAINLTPQSQISASTTGSGKGGDLILTAPDSITLSGAGKLAVETRGSGNAGNITVRTGQVTLTDGVELSASSTGNGRAGNLNILVDEVTLAQGARITSNAASTGAAGDITLTVGNQLRLNGAGTGIFAETTLGSTGAGGNIGIGANQVWIEDGAAISVDSLGHGTGGNITLQANRLTLNQQGRLSAETASTQGGNITLNLQDLLLLRYHSLISTTAGTAQAGGNGGNITINVPKGFVVGVLSEDSDIRANAFTGRGGKVNITAQGIFGLQFQPRNTPNSDITASSQFGISGTVQLNTLGIDPSSGLVKLPDGLVDSSRKLVDLCGNAADSSFVVTGKGGLPANPLERLESPLLWEDLRDLSEFEHQAPVKAPPRRSETPTTIVEANAIRRNPDGTMELVATGAESVPIGYPVSCAGRAWFSETQR
jgi:large exoprotein involved in heme utilization and adhesion